MTAENQEPPSFESQPPPQPAAAKKDVWGILESLSKIIAALGIPVVLGAGGWVIQSTISQQTVSKDYVTIALGILQKDESKDGSQSNTGLRRWAVALLNSTSPVRLDPTTEQQLISGKLNIEIPQAKTLA